MKVLLIKILLFISIVVGASEPYRIAVITDIHYLSPQLMDGGYAVENYMQTTGRMIKYTPEVLDSVLSHITNDKTDIKSLLICGDLTKDGERQSHLDFAKKLEALKNKGIQTFVIPGNHDINIPSPMKYIGNKSFKTESVSPAEFEEIYKDYGYNNCFSRDTTSLSYATVLHKDTNNSETWLIAIDAARYEDYKTSSISAGRIKRSTEQWIMDILEQAKNKKAQVYGMMHWGLTEHFPMQGELMPNYIVNDWKRLADKFADMGMSMIFTGHSHANDITKHTSQKGNTIYDIETGTLSSYPFTYRIIDDFSTKTDIYTYRIEATEENPNLAKQSKAILSEIADKMVESRINKFAPNIDIERRQYLSGLLAQLFIMHVHGDENGFSEYNNIIKELGDEYEINDFNLDFEPMDNDITINKPDARIISIP
ncbi:metallophosphoesterase family protein [Dysgonomonas massiliensis]|uniref:metallophosphoesterase family protein n=1 Tax=Dysgonomonas massiliensis TaxID=2040292 RepID=UPI000C771E15|nr:metallophosphoesterase [Dysgonomonas massiliensis]